MSLSKRWTILLLFRLFECHSHRFIWFWCKFRIFNCRGGTVTWNLSRCVISFNTRREKMRNRAIERKRGEKRGSLPHLVKRPFNEMKTNTNKQCPCISAKPNFKWKYVTMRYTYWKTNAWIIIRELCGPLDCSLTKLSIRMLASNIGDLMELNRLQCTSGYFPFKCVSFHFYLHCFVIACRFYCQTLFKNSHDKTRISNKTTYWPKGINARGGFWYTQ